MQDVSKHLGPLAAATNAPRLPAAFDRATWQAELDTLRVREKAHTRAGDAFITDLVATPSFRSGVVLLP